MPKNGKIKNFKTNDAIKIFDKLSKVYNEKIIYTWKEKVVKDINELFIKYKVVDFKVNKNSYMGIVIDCLSLELNEIFIKIIPPMINRFKVETGTLKRIEENIRCKIYEIDKTKNAIVMEKIKPGTIAEFYPNKELYKDLFKTLYENKIEITEDIEDNYRDFSEVVLRDYHKCKEVHHENELVDILYKKFVKRYTKLLYGKNKYLLHGDVYKNNALLSDNKIKVIDPLGFKAPFVMELLSVCAYEMFYNENKSNKEILKDFIEFFKEYVDEQTYKDALFCQLVKVYIPSLFEANDGGIRASKWLNIINELYLEV